jgi:hypothetical protein
MIPYIGCETAQGMLEAFIDGELPMADQVAVESHLRWCRTCGARVEDMQLIGASLRTGAQPLAPSETRALGAMQADVLARIRAEHDISFPVRLRSMFDDMRLLWPAVGATTALAACLLASLSVMQAATAENPESLAAMIERLDRQPTPVLTPAIAGSDQNPMRMDSRVSFPRAIDGASPMESLSEDEAAFAVAAVVNREGRIATYALVPSPDARPASAGSEVSAVLDGVKRSRFAPAEAAGGTKVAVNMVWLLVRSTVRGTARVHADPAPPAPASAEPPVILEDTPSVPSTEAPSAAASSTTA